MIVKQNNGDMTIYDTEQLLTESFKYQGNKIWRVKNKHSEKEDSKMPFGKQTATTADIKKAEPKKDYTLELTDKLQDRFDTLGETDGQSAITKGKRTFYFFSNERPADSGKSGQIGFGNYIDRETGEKYKFNVRWFDVDGKTHLAINEPQSKGKDDKYYSDYRVSETTRKNALDVLATGEIEE